MPEGTGGGSRWQATRAAIYGAIGLAVFVGAPEMARWINGGAYAQPTSALPTAPTITQRSTGDCSPNIVGSNNTNNCNPVPTISASSQTQAPGGRLGGAWQSTFAITTNVPIQTGDLKLTCDRPCLLAIVDRNFARESGANGPVQGDPNTVLYQLGAETLEPGYNLVVGVVSENPAKVISGSVGLHKIHINGDGG